MVPLPEHAPSVLSTSGTLLIASHDADAAPSPAIVYLSHPSILFVHSLCYVYCRSITIKILLIYGSVEIKSSIPNWGQREKGGRRAEGEAWSPQPIRLKPISYQGRLVSLITEVQLPVLLATPSC